MRRLFTLLAAGLLVLAVAAPATASPEIGKNKHVSIWEIDCTASNMPEFGVFTVTAKGVPGWPTEPLSSSPMHFVGGTFYVYAGGVLVEGPIPYPVAPGLSDKLDLGPCYMHLAGGSIGTFDIVAPDSWYIIPAEG